MRKVLSFVLVLSLVLGSFGMAFAATPTASDVAGKACEEAVNVLTELSVVSGYADGTYKPENVVTRAEMATLIVKALGLNDYAVGTPKFTDSKTHWAKGYIAYANSLGIISGRTATTFVPDAIVTYDEAATMLVKALGYEDATLVGTWPTSYVTKAKVLGILDGIKSGAAGANRGDIAIMVYQTLDQAIGKVNKDGDWVGTATSFNADGTTATFDTMLARLDASMFDGGNGAGKAFVLTNAQADAAAANVRKYIGASVTAYANDDGDILAVKEVKSSFLTGKFTKANTFEVDDVEYTFNTSKITESAVFVNAYAGADASIPPVSQTEYTIAADVSGKTLKDIFSVSTWRVDQAAQFEKADAEDITEDQKLLGEKFILNDDKELDTSSFNLVGVASLEDIAVDDVVYVYKNTDGIAKVAVGATKVSGEVTKIKGTGLDTKYTIDGKEYKFADGAVVDGVISSRPDVENVIEARLDAYGRIYTYEKTKGTADTFAVVLDASNGETGFAGKDAKVKLFLSDGTDKAFAVDYKEIDASIITDGGTKIISWEPGTAAAGKVTTGAIIKYSVDKNGVIDDIEVMTNNATTATKVSEKGNYAGKPIAKDATIFTYSTKDSDEDNYGVTTLDKILDTTMVVGGAYNVNDDNEIDVMLIDNDSVGGGDDIFGVVIDTEKNSANADGWGIDMLIDGSEKYQPATKDGASGGSAKDVLYMLKFNVNGSVSELKDAANNTDTYGYITMTTTTGLTVTGRNVEFTTPATLNLAKGGTNSANIDIATKNIITIASDAVVYVWNNGEYEKGTVRSIMNDTTTFVKLFDVFDKDGVYDIVLVK